jgi:hypothetical protein
MPFGTLFALAGGFIAPRFGSRHGKARDFSAVCKGVNLRVFAKSADYDCFVN